MKTFSAILVALIVASTVALAQTVTVTNANQFTFIASNDHDKGGTLTRYDLEIEPKATPGSIVATLNLGKPSYAPTTFKITVRQDEAGDGLAPGVEYLGYIVAVGPNGRSPRAKVNKILVFGPPAAPSGADAQNVR